MSVARRSLQIVAFIATLIVGVTSMAVIVTQTTWFKEWLRGFIVRQAEDYVNGRLSIGRLDGNLFFGVELEDVDVTMNGQRVVEVKDVGLNYNAFTFIGGDVVLDTIRLNKPVMRLEKTPQGWNLTQLIKARTPDPKEPKARRTEESSLRVVGAVRNVENGRLVLDIKATSDKLALNEIARLVPALRGLPLQPAFELSARGPADRLAIDVNAREAQVGNVIGNLTVDVVEPERRVAGTVHLAHFNVAPVVKNETLKSDISGQGQLDLTLPSGQQPLSGTYSIDASRAMVAGYEARNLKAKGRIDGDTVRLDGSAAAYGARATAA